MVLALQLCVDRWKPFEELSALLLDKKQTAPITTGNDVMDRMLARARFRQQYMKLVEQAGYDEQSFCPALAVAHYIGRLQHMERIGSYCVSNLTAYCYLVEQVLLESYIPKTRAVPPRTQLRAKIGWLEHCQGVLATIEV